MQEAQGSRQTNSKILLKEKNSLINRQMNFMMSKYLWLIGSSIFVIFGTIHLLYTFFTDKFSSRNVRLIEEMKSSHPILTDETTVWKAWVGFNASHSSGVIFIGAINFYLAFRYFEVLQAETFFFIFNILTVGFYLWLGNRYWFRIPFRGILVTLVCFIVSYILS